MRRCSTSLVILKMPFMEKLKRPDNIQCWQECKCPFICCVKNINWDRLFFFLPELGLCCCTQVFSRCGERGLLFIVVRGLLIAVASLIAEHRLQAHRLQQLQHVGSAVGACRLSSYGSQALEHRLSSCGTRAQLLGSMWDLPRPGIKPMSPALAGRFLTTVPTAKSWDRLFEREFDSMKFSSMKILNAYTL